MGAIIPIFALIVLRLILSSLPMLKNAGPMGDTGVTPLALTKAAIDTAIYFLIVRFTWVGARTIRSARPHLTELATILSLAGFALVATLAYSGYEQLVLTFIPDSANIYNWTFLVLVLAPIGAIVVIITRRLDFFTNLLFGKMSGALQTPPPMVFAAATGARPAGAPPTIQPAGTGPIEPLQQRLDAAAIRVSAAKEVISSFRTRGALPPDLADSAAKMDAYFEGATQNLQRHDALHVQHHHDWAEYEANRVLAQKDN